MDSIEPVGRLDGRCISRRSRFRCPSARVHGDLGTPAFRRLNTPPPMAGSISGRARRSFRMGRLGNVKLGRVRVDCASSKRSGRYTVASLIERFGPDISTVDLLRHLTASCRYQRRPGVPPARKYEHLCLAAFTLPARRQVNAPVPPPVSPTRSRCGTGSAASSRCNSPPSTRWPWRSPPLRSPARSGRRTRSRFEIGLGSCGGGSRRSGAPPRSVSMSLTDC
jgi:hypothetical protein